MSIIGTMVKQENVNYELVDEEREDRDDEEKRSESE